MLSTHRCIFVAARSFRSKDGKICLLLSFVGDDGNLYSDVFIDSAFSDVLASKTFGDSLSLDLEIARFNGNWRVNIISIS